MSDLVKRLRDAERSYRLVEAHDLFGEAAKRIESLEAQLETMENHGKELAVKHQITCDELEQARKEQARESASILGKAKEVRSLIAIGQWAGDKFDELEAILDEAVEEKGDE